MRARHSTPEHPPLTPGLLGLLAGGAGVTVANIYYNQSLLVLMAREFHVSSAIGAIAVATQLGYASGLLLLVPLGDILDRKKLIIGSATATACAMLVLTFAPGFLCAVLVSYLVGLLGITPQFIIPYVASLADPERRGRAVGLVMGGLLVGILLARTVAGFMGQAVGWRAVCGMGAALTFAIACALLKLPSVPLLHPGLSYAKLLRSLPPLLAREPVLQRCGLLGAIAFGAFSAFWTTLALYLASRPEHYGGNMVGAFGFVGIAGALVAPVAGHLSDRFSARWVNGACLTLMSFSFLLMLGADASLLVLALGVFLMDAGTQGNQISNQTRIYTLHPQLRNRITSVYMVCYFAGGALGSACGAVAWTFTHWTGVCLLGAALSLAGLPILFYRGGGKDSALADSAAS